MTTACLAASHKKCGIDAIDRAFLKAIKDYPGVKDELEKFEVLDYSSFDPVSKMVTATVRSNLGDRVICVKGAPSSIMKMALKAGPLPQQLIEEYNEKVASFASRGFRSLGVACKAGDSHWQLLGIMPCSDPLRHDTAKTIREAVDLGLKIKILTGDAVGIAKETSRQLGLGENIYNSERLGLGGGGDMPGSAIYDFVEAADGFAEVFPQHKYNVVDILQRRGYLVAMTGDGVNDAPSLKKADTGIAVEGSSDAARSAADMVFLAPGLSAIIDAIKTSRQIFHRMHAYVVYRIALSLHMMIFLGVRIASSNDSLKIQLVVFLAIFADIATLTMAYDKAPFSRTPVKWNLPKLWGISVIMGLMLAGASFLCLTTMTYHPTPEGDVSGGIAENYGKRDSILFLQIALSQNWLIFITRADGPFWVSWPSWQLILAVLTVDVVATLFCAFGWFNGGQMEASRHLGTTARVWVFCFGVFCLMAIVYYLLYDLVAFDRLMHGKWPCRRKHKNKAVDDLSKLLPGLVIAW